MVQVNRILLIPASHDFGLIGSNDGLIPTNTIIIGIIGTSLSFLQFPLGLTLTNCKRICGSVVKFVNFQISMWHGYQSCKPRLKMKTPAQVRGGISRPYMIGRRLMSIGAYHQP